MNLKPKTLTSKQYLWNPASVPDVLPEFRSNTGIYEDTQEALNTMTNIVTGVNTVRKVLKKKKANLAFGLDVSIDKDTYSSDKYGFGPKYRHAILGQLHCSSQKDIEKSFRYWWPRCPFTAQPMRYIGSVNVGYHTWAFNALTEERLEYGHKLSPFVSDSLMSGPFECVYNFWIANDLNFERPLFPTCAVSMTRLSKYFDEEKVFDHAPFEKLFNEYQERALTGAKSTGLDISIPEGDINKVNFYVDIDQFDTDKEHIYTWDLEKKHKILKANGTFQMFGAARSQQEPKRPLAQNQYLLPHANMPVLSFNDAEADMTYQLYSRPFQQFITADTYGFVDSSCT